MRRTGSDGLTVTLVQSSFTADDYRSAGAFRNKVLSTCARVPAARFPRRLVVFPELTGLWIPLLRGRRSTSLPALALSLLLAHPLGILGGLSTGRRMAALFRVDWHSSHSGKWPGAWGPISAPVAPCSPRSTGRT